MNNQQRQRPQSLATLCSVNYTHLSLPMTLGMRCSVPTSAAKPNATSCECVMRGVTTKCMQPQKPRCELLSCDNMGVCCYWCGYLDAKVGISRAEPHICCTNQVHTWQKHAHNVNITEPQKLHNKQQHVNLPPPTQAL